MLETKPSGNKTNSEEIGNYIRAHASPNVERDQVYGGAKVICWHATPVTNALRKSRIIRS